MPKRPGAYLVVFVYISLPFCHHITMSPSSSCPCHLGHERLLAAAKQHLEQNKKARLRMAQKRADLKLRSPEEQELAAQRSRVYRARYRQKNHQAVLRGESERRRKIYIERYGESAYKDYVERREGKRMGQES
ncbi:hypothetical protein DFH08DRAFT_943691 [Mycena albidolilacea]|uniref:Uncharacterized protein n=1 Tax=Mycena albidolilacea TaxID=1033008 RepID=A0AAD6Z8B3_9AGAR|nr:hypothetical protein DFH08DRAFT_943691 [Mycena albidolilacea]